MRIHSKSGNMKSKILKNSLFLLICLKFGIFRCSYGLLDDVPFILDEFKIHHPIIINNLIDTKDLVSIIKCMSFLGHQINFSQNQSYKPYQSYLIFTNLKNFKWNQPTYGPILVVSKFQNEIELNKVDVSIGSQVLFIDWFSLKVYESYTVNKIHVTRYLGQFRDQKIGKNDMKFFHSKDYIPCIEKRRQNFHGLQIKVGITKSRLGISDPAKFPNEVKFFPKNNTYDVTTIVATTENKSLMSIMILKWMETKFNFTAQVFLRKDMKFGYGSPKVLSNRSIVLGEGVVRDMAEGLVDFIGATMIMLPELSQFGTFLPPIYEGHDAIYIPIIDSNEHLDWNVFFGPFSFKLWIAVILKCIIFAVFIYVVEWFHNYKLVCCYVVVAYIIFV